MQKLKESDTDRVNLEIMAGLSGKDRENYIAGLRKLGISNPVDKADLRAAFKRYLPDATDRELDIMVLSEPPQDTKPAWII